MNLRIDNMGRNRKKLEDKSTSLIFRIDNKTLFKLCDKFDIEYDKTAEIMDNHIKNSIIVEIKSIITNYVK